MAVPIHRTTPLGGVSMNTRTLAIIALVIAIIVALYLIL